MRRLIYIVVTVLLVMSSCTIETTDNGKLDGFWHLERIDTLSTGGSTDLSGELKFWTVQFKLLQLRGDGIYTLRFRQTADSLIVSEPYKTSTDVVGDDEDGDVKVTDPSELRQFGLQHLEENFVKEEMKSSRMVLRSDSLRLYFKKF